ncbi:MAG: hypothetical protein LIP08_06405 [Bacteroides sp.]|nr:hypothetical protein [Bacteroides sp.]
MTYLEKLDKLHPDLINTFLTTGHCDGVPAEIQVFLKQLQWAAEIFEYERNISRASKKLRERIAAQQKLQVDVRTCMSRIYAAINYFNVDNNVSVKVWEGVYADKFEDIAKLAALKGDVRSMERCTEKARECRARASEADQADRQWAPVFIISPEITPEELGYKKRSLKEIACKSNKGYYINLIETLPIEKEDKTRLLADAGIVDAEFEEITGTEE